MRLPESPLDLACLLCTTWQDSLFLCHIRAGPIPGNYLPLYLLHKIEASQYQWFGRPSFLNPQLLQNAESSGLFLPQLGQILWSLIPQLLQNCDPV